MRQKCPSCGAAVLEIDVRCATCGATLGTSGAHRMLGATLLGQYVLVDVLGQGGMSVVYKGRHEITGQEVALKLLPPELAAHSQVKSRFVEEARALAALDHPNIVHLYNFGQENGSFVLAMQLVQGRTWERLIVEAGRLDWPRSCRIAIDVLRALEYAHGRGVIHRDMKPSNVLVRDHDGSATVMDFGIAKMTTSTKLTATGQTMGTVRYMSPEQVRGHEVDLRTDIYSLGATLYESLTGETPFDGSTHFEIMTKHLSDVPRRPSARGVEVPLPVEDALMRSLAKRAEDRFATARDLRKILEQALRDSDLGLVETQRLSAGDLRGAAGVRASTTDLGATALGAQVTSARDLEAPEAAPDRAGGRVGARAARSPGGRVATATDVTDAPARRRGRRLAAWAALAVALAAGGVGGALAVRGRALGHRPAMALEGVQLVEGARFGALVVETDGSMAPDEVAAVYHGELAALRELGARARPALDVPDPVDQIAVLPRAAMCLKANWLAEPPRDCAEQASAALFGPRGEHRMFLIADRALLRDGVRRGLAQAICELTTAAPREPGAAARSRERCALAELFLGGDAQGPAPRD